MKQSLLEWRRCPRSDFILGHEAGVYALFLREDSTLPGVEPGEQGLLYIGLAANRKGLSGRCHFDARTRNHSPRKSLAVLLMDELGLAPVLIIKPNSADTWGLDGPSEARLSRWMHDNLDLAIEVCTHPDARETELVGRYAPPLNLKKCVQTEQHRRISRARASVMAQLQERGVVTFSDNLAHERRRPKMAFVVADDAASATRQSLHSARQWAGADIDTAVAIAARYGLNPKSYRQRLRVSIPWYRKPQEWTFPVDSTEWRDMIAVAEKMT
ncbi:GIY-YIG nuclease family protein [Sphingopyxis sp.]|jgi:hypothetical protein|uniref:GIY-YIG nuclease family protein n=1 Tax=Sphingopyxis sp. TaxID=1908224 RepID=UPI0025D79929|nr:hypothetical protein [Sphingopyxis sp.]MBK6414182.1 hypothetical protein [Sphingopyxis sp.]